MPLTIFFELLMFCLHLGSFFFFLSFWRTHVLLGGHWYPCFGFLVTSPLGFKARVGFLIRIAEANVMYVPWDPPLVLHLPTYWLPACIRSCPHILFQRWGCWDSNSCSQNICEPEALPTELNRDRLLVLKKGYEATCVLNTHIILSRKIDDPCTVQVVGILPFSSTRR